MVAGFGSSTPIDYNFTGVAISNLVMPFPQTYSSSFSESLYKIPVTAAACVPHTLSIYTLSFLSIGTFKGTLKAISLKSSPNSQLLHFPYTHNSGSSLFALSDLDTRNTPVSVVLTEAKASGSSSSFLDFLYFLYSFLSMALGHLPTAESNCSAVGKSMRCRFGDRA
jgi:hypothetical protein